MSKYHGKVGYAIPESKTLGVVIHKIVERPHYGDVSQNTVKWEKGEGLNDNLDINTEISIVADPFAMTHFHMIRYVEYFGARWTVKRAVPSRPRIKLTLGGVYNGPTPETSFRPGGDIGPSV